MVFSSLSWYKLLSLFKQLLPDFPLANLQVPIELVVGVAAVGTRVHVLGLLHANHFVGVQRVFLLDFVGADLAPRLMHELGLAKVLSLPG